MVSACEELGAARECWVTQRPPHPQRPLSFKGEGSYQNWEIRPPSWFGTGAAPLSRKPKPMRVWLGGAVPQPFQVQRRKVAAVVHRYDEGISAARITQRTKSSQSS